MRINPTGSDYVEDKSYVKTLKQTNWENLVSSIRLLPWTDYQDIFCMQYNAVECIVLINSDGSSSQVPLPINWSVI